MAAVALPCAAFAGAYGDMFREGHLRFDYTPQEIASLEASASEELEKNLAALTAVPVSRRNFNNTVLALENAYTQYWFVPKNLSLLAYFHKDANVREAAARLETIGSKKKAEIFSRRDVYRALKEYAQTNPTLEHEEARLLAKWLERYERAGMSLSDAKLKKYLKLNDERLEKITRYNVNLNNYKDEIILTPEQLKGMGETYVNRLSRTEDGRYIVTLKYPDYNPFMANAQDDAARKELQTKFARRGGKENVKLLEDTLVLRRKQAALLGYKQYPDFVLPVRMAKTQDNLRAFLQDLQTQITPLAQAEMQERTAAS